MNKIFLLITTCLTFFTVSFSQNSEDEPQNVIVDWKPGTEKTIFQTDSTVIFKDDSVFMATGVSSGFNIKIVSLKDTVYEVLFKQVKIDSDVKVESELVDADPLQKMMQELLAELQKELLGFEYSFLVNKNTALAFEVKNQALLRKKIEELIVVVLNQFMDASKIELNENEKKELHLKLKEYMNEQMPAAMQTMLNSFNYIFQAYSFPFVLNKTYTIESVVYNVDQIQHGEKENPATFIINSSLKNSILNIDYVYQYDKEAAYQNYIVSKGKDGEIPIEEFDTSERVNTDFDIKSSWILKSTSFVNVKMGMIKVSKTTHVIIK